MAHTQPLNQPSTKPLQPKPLVVAKQNIEFSFAERVVLPEGPPCYTVAQGSLRVLARREGEGEAALCLLGQGQVLPAALLAGPRAGVLARASRGGLVLEPSAPCRAATLLHEGLLVVLQLLDSCPELSACADSLLGLVRGANRLGIESGRSVSLSRERASLSFLLKGSVVAREAGGERRLNGLTALAATVELRASEDAELLVFSETAVEQARRISPALHDYVSRVWSQRPRQDDGAEPSVRASAVETPRKTRPEPVIAERSTEPRRRPRRGVPFVAQVDESDCGVACLTMVARHYRLPLELSAARAIARIGRSGLGLQNLCSAARALGLVAVPLKVSRSNLDRLTLPAILHWDERHWVVLVRRGRRPLIADPARGTLRVSRRELERRWDGYAAEIQPGSSASWSGGQRQERLLMPQVRAHTGSLLLVAALTIGGALLSVVLPLLSQIIVDRVVVGGAEHSLVGLLTAMTALFVIVLSAQGVQRYVRAQVAARVDAALVARLSSRLLSLPFEYFLQRRNGDIQRRLRSARELREFVLDKGLDGVLSVVSLLLAVVAVALYARSLLWIYLVGLPVYAAGLLLAWRAIRPIIKQSEEAQAKHESEQYEIVAGVGSIKSADAEGYAHKRIMRTFADVARSQFRGEVLMCWYEAGVRFLSYALSTLVLWQSARLVMAGSLTLGGLVAVLGLTPMISGPLLQLLGIWDELQRVRVLRDRIADVIDHPSEARPELAHAQLELSGKLALSQAGFHYSGKESQPALQGIDLEILPGEKVALVGESGCGKSTLAKIMAALLPCVQGRVAFDDIDAKRLHHTCIRNKVMLVPQLSELVPGSVLENIALEAEPDWARAVEAAKVAEAHDFIERLPEGYHTKMGSGQGDLSGGQVQRLALARAVYRAPRVLILDEATSALDSRTEALVRRNLFAHFARSTVIIVSHRLSTIKDVERIVVLDGGRVVEAGTHAELSERGGLYFDLMQRQAA